MAIAHQHTDTSGGTASAGATQAITLPAGGLSTEWAIAVLGANVTSQVAVPSISAPAGWTRIGPSSGKDTVDGSNNHAYVTAFIGAVNNANLTFTLTNLSGASVAYAVADFSGLDGTTQIDVQDTTGAGSTGASTVASPAVTIATANAWLMLAGIDFNGGNLTATGFTVKEAPAADCTATVFYNTTPKSTGSTGTQTITSSASATGQILAAFTFALRPAAAAATQTPYDIPHSPQHQAMVAM